jgi:hypothetical protein
MSCIIILAHLYWLVLYMHPTVMMSDIVIIMTNEAVTAIPITIGLLETVLIKNRYSSS